MGKEERWAVSAEFPRYEVSNLGRIRHIGGVPRKIRSMSGYAYVCIRQGGKAHNIRLHRLIASTFIPNPENKPHVNHKDGNRSNNEVDNLEWCTASENECHKVNVLGIKQKPPIRQTAVVCVETNRTFESIKDAADQMHIDRKHIGEAAAGNREGHH